MPSQDADLRASQQPNRHRRAPSRVLPAIPLALTKSKPAKLPSSPKVNGNNGYSPARDDRRSGTQNMTNRVEKGEVEPISRSTDSTQARAVDDDRSYRQLENGEQQHMAADHALTPSMSCPGTVEPAPHPTLFDGVANEQSVKDQEPTYNHQRHPEVESSSPTVTSSPVASRKPVDRPEMRHIRTELPPAFVPSAEQHTPHSATSYNRPPVSGLSHPHGHHPSATNIVFGGSHGSSTSSPAPPMSAGSAFGPPSHPGNPPFLPTHGHHNSEALRMYSPGLSQPPAQWPSRPPGFGPQISAPHYHPHAHLPWQHPPPPPPAPPPQANGHAGSTLTNGNGSRSRSGSQASSGIPEAQRPATDLQSPVSVDHGLDGAKSNIAGYQTAFSTHGRHFSVHQQNVQPPPPPQFPPTEFSMGLENAVSLRDHVLGNFRAAEFSDCFLQIAESDGGGRQYLEAHKLVLSRSPTLLAIIRHSEPPSTSGVKTQVRIFLPDRYVRVGSFLEAVRYLYGGPLPSPDTYGPSFAHLGNEERMEVALQHIATGAWLRVAAIAARGVDLAASFLNWESVTSALAFALGGGLGLMWVLDDGSDERTSTCSSDDSFSKPEAGGSPRYGSYSTALLHRIIEQFMVHSLPPDFYLDSTAPQLASCPRLPSFVPGHESKPSRSDPRLSKIRFGEFQEVQRPSMLTTAISSVLLSLPFPLLKYLLENPVLCNNIGAETVASIIRQVVHEREVRRTKVLQYHTSSRPADTRDSHLAQNLFWEESVEPSTQLKAGSRLVRRHKDIDTPPSSGAGSEQAK